MHILQPLTRHVGTQTPEVLHRLGCLGELGDVGFGLIHTINYDTDVLVGVVPGLLPVFVVLISFSAMYNKGSQMHDLYIMYL